MRSQSQTGEIWKPEKLEVPKIEKMSITSTPRGQARPAQSIIVVSYYHQITTPTGWSHFRCQVSLKNGLYHLYPFAKDLSPPPKKNASKATIAWDEHATDAQKFIAPPKRRFFKNENWPWIVLEKFMAYFLVRDQKSKIPKFWIVWKAFWKSSAPIRANLEGKTTIWNSRKNKNCTWWSVQEDT